MVSLVLLGVEVTRSNGRVLGDVDGMVGGGAGDEVLFARGEGDESDVGVGVSVEGLELLSSPESDSGSVGGGEVGSERGPLEVVVSPSL